MSVSRFLQTVLPPAARLADPSLFRGLVLAAGFAYFAFNPGERRTIEANAGNFLARRRMDKARLPRVFAHTLEHYFEKLLVANRSRSFIDGFLRDRIAISGAGILERAVSPGRGAIAVTAHWGAAELIPPMLARMGYPVSVVLETATKSLRKALERLVAGTDVELIIASRGDRVLERILDSLGRGRILVTQVDEVDSWRRRKSRTIDFYGERIYFDHTLDFIAKKADAPVVGVFCGRVARLRYRLAIEEIAMEPGDEDVSEKAFRIWERYLVESPEQWYQWKKWGAMKAPIDPLPA